MALTPSERRARRDASAQQRINPDTGLPFRNYNALDTWQRNQRAKLEGYTSRTSKRRFIERKDALVEQLREQFPNSFDNYLDGREPTAQLAAEFQLALGHSGKSRKGDSFFRKALRARITLKWNTEDWSLWRVEYQGV